ncbi:Putative beta-1,3-glucanase, Osmotin/thaumatin-like superfamily, glucan endo-1,3-beta-glucosidase [Septoria linicola]|uniref:Beta-1,3-glucanase, Osmotin/thaumatin-like superfamily, glucan endo-1,3-beta-glucosidase n=1 Tax=Septoria linicola TaxID=215465 RepID=A0A9Q9AS00_9PEZI|nr:Putative beta-1,3-glucanase, Osmotin/thaumatin-like superfamily, glucan endo-1,3-beta-glucosidase [Septoria linicola]
MHTLLSLPPLFLLLLPQLVGSIPLEHKLVARAKEEVWVRDFNTLNATTWNGQEVPRIFANSSTTGTTTRTAGTFANGTTYVIDTPSKNNSTNETTIVSGTGRLIPFPPPALIAAANRTSTNATRLPADADDLSRAASNGVLTLSIVNKWPSENLHIYISGLDTNGALIMLGTDGKYLNPTTNSATPVPVTGNIAIPVGKPNTTLTLTLPGYIESSRVWIVDGTLAFNVVATPRGPGLVEPAAVNPADPSSSKNYGFVELSWAAAYGIYADITAVDFIGLPLGIELEDSSNAKHSILGTPSNAATWLCDKLKAQAKKDKQPWDQSCMTGSKGEVLRILAPSSLISLKPDAFKGYYDKYVNNAWSKYAKEDLIIDTQTDAGKVKCRVKGDQLQCAGDNRGYAKPSAMDIFGCDSGPFSIQSGDNGVHLAVVPRLCAAFNRSTLFLKGGNIQPNLSPKDYYRTPKSGPNSNNPPKNWYSKYVHDMEHESRGYAFPYDDVTARPEDDQSGLVSSTSPRLLRIIVGGT